MNETIRNMITRRSCRAFKPDMLPQDVIDQIIEAGLYAASGRNTQSPIILAVTNKAVRDELSELNRRFLPGAAHDPFYGAPVVLAVLAPRSVSTYLYDGSLVIGNMMLAAHALGVGSCWIHRAKETFDDPAGKAILTAHGITGDYEGIGNCVLGYPAADPEQPLPRKDDRVYKI